MLSFGLYTLVKAGVAGTNAVLRKQKIRGTIQTRLEDGPQLYQPTSYE